ISVAEIQILGTILQPNTEVAFGFAKNLVWIVLAAVGNGRIFLPLNRRKAADPGNDTAELVRHLPCGIEGADAAGGESRDSTAVSIFADVVFGCDFGNDFVTKKTNVAIVDSIVQGATHRVFQGALPFIRIGLHKLIHGRAGRVGDVAWIDENTD